MNSVSRSVLGRALPSGRCLPCTCPTLANAENEADMKCGSCIRVLCAPAHHQDLGQQIYQDQDVGEKGKLRHDSSFPFYSRQQLLVCQSSYRLFFWPFPLPPLFTPSTARCYTALALSSLCHLIIRKTAAPNPLLVSLVLHLTCPGPQHGIYRCHELRDLCEPLRKYSYGELAAG